VRGARDDAGVAEEPDLGGDPACWAHLFDEPGVDPAPTAAPLVVDLAAVGRPHASAGRPGGAVDGPVDGPVGGVVWSLPHGGDLDANLVRLPGGSAIVEHVEGVLDVFVVVQAGTGELTVDGRPIGLHPDVAVLVPRGARRAVAAGPDGLSYLTVHRRRPSLGPSRRS
jgi:quercetin dioxygenase-like cupin family protein